VLFSSIEFVCVFLPVTLGLFLLLRQRVGPNASQGLLNLASLAFYGWWDIRYLPLLLGSVLFNWRLSQALPTATGRQGSLLALGVGLNLALLAVFKYLHFVANTALWLGGSEWRLAALLLPLGISFFTFQQIAYLVEVRRGHYPPARLGPYLLFVAFFPQLIAGPIVQYAHLAPQFAQQRRDEPVYGNLAIGLTFFVVGLFKKLVLADGIGPRVDELFAAVEAGASLSLIEAWALLLGFAMQLYFDFSGYSDMAIGLARMFGILLPVNFLSPYKATDIADFWRRWHITLSSFLRDYLYIPLGGSRGGQLATARNLFLTMLLGGLWHGAGWTFVVWGALHGVFLAVHQAFRVWAGPRPPGFAGRVLTFLCVAAALAFFRATSVEAALSLLAGAAGLHGVALPAARQLGPAAALLAPLGLPFSGTPFLFRPQELAILALMCAIAWTMPNMCQVMAAHQPALGLPRTLAPAGRLAFRPGLAWGALTTAMAGVAFFRLNATQVFLYYTF
jgi:D-alanyl-lipoteichoic acid acyltransferase DltB (MBOAT superfamily)